MWIGFPKLEGLVYTPTHHGLIGRKNQIITILDLIPLHFPSQHRFQYLYFKHLLPKIMHNSLAIFTISESVKKEIADYYKYPLKRIYVVPCGLEQEKFSPSSSAQCVNQPYILVVGAAYFHKNIHELIHNYRLWKNRYCLKIVGSRGQYRKYLEKLVFKYDLQAVVEFVSYLSDDDLLKLMQRCKALIYPSLCEGFGMPPLEVMACGRPAIVSDIPVHREIGQDVPIFVTLGNSESWAKAFYLLENKQFLEKRVAKGMELVKQFTWQRSGEILVNTLLQVDPRLSTQRHTEL